jgi:hypothetical protein
MKKIDEDDEDGLGVLLSLRHHRIEYTVDSKEGTCASANFISTWHALFHLV